MTREEIMNLDMEALEERSKAIAEETREADIEKLEELNMELDNIEQRKNEIKATAEETREKMLDVLEGAGETVEEPKEERKPMEKIEVRNTPEYLDAWVENLKGRATEEQRALLTTNVSDGTVAVPVYVDDTIHTAWENNEILRRVRKSYYPGNLKVGYEVSATGAAFHTEGGDEIEEEELVLGIVDLIPTMVKKYVSFSDEALDMRGEAFVDYVVDEITDKIIKGAIEMILGTVHNSTLTQTYTAAGSTLSTADLIGAEGLLSGEASNPVLITSRANAAALKAAALSANYGYDPFDGMDVLYHSVSLPANVLGLVADLSGVQANFPSGEEVKIKIDELTLATSDLVKVIGRLYVAAGVVAPGKTVKIVTA